MSLAEVKKRLKEALDVERVTKRFFDEFQALHLVFLELIEGIDDESDRRWYASILLNRLMFIYFLQRKLFLDNGDELYLQNKLAVCRREGDDLFYATFLKTLFFEGFAKPEEKRSPEVNTRLGRITYLNGGLFLLHRIELDWPAIRVPDKAFENLFALFGRYSWNLNDTPGGKDDEINPDVLGYIFEKYINQKAFGAYYTRPEITEYLCERTIHKLVLDKICSPGVSGVAAPRHFESVGDLLLGLDADLCRRLLHEVLPKLRLLDPACGSAAFLVAAMKTLINIYAAVIGRIEFLNDRNLKSWLDQVKKDHPNVNYYIKKTIITENLFGVDIHEEAVEIAKLRLFLALVAAADAVDDLEPLPNIDFNILPGNSLIGLMRVDDKEFEQHQPDLFAQTANKSYIQILEEKNRLVKLYRNASSYSEDLRTMRDKINSQKTEAIAILNEMLLNDFTSLDIKFEQATWDAKKNDEGKPRKRSLEIGDIEALQPFHWGFEFDEVINRSGGFDAIITNPPWEIFKPNAKEFFEGHSDLVSKKKMTIKEFEKEQGKLLKDPDIRGAWLAYLSGYPHLSAFFRSALQYKNQISVVNGKKAGTDINLYKLFLEQCYNLLRKGGRCGIIIPSGVYTDLGTKQLREMLFGSCEVDTLFGLSNEKFIFEAVHHAFKFSILSFAKEGKTTKFQAAFRINPREAVAPDRLDDFLHSPNEYLDISVDLIRRLSPDSLSVMEFKNPMDVGMAEKMLKFPLLGEEIPDKWNLRLTAEFHMTNDSHLFKTEPGKGRLPLYEGKMIWQFDHQLADPRYWVDEKMARGSLHGSHEDNDQTFDYEAFRLGIRAVSGSVNERTLVSAIIPQSSFCGNSILVTKDKCLKGAYLLVVSSFLNSFLLDAFLRQKVSQNVNMFFIYQLPIPRLTEKDAAFGPIVERAARLVCVSPEFDDLAKEVGLKSHKNGVVEPLERAKLRAELDGLVAHLYGLTEEEFAYILTTFPLVPDPVKIAAHNAFRNVEKGLIQ